MISNAQFREIGFVGGTEPVKPQLRSDEFSSIVNQFFIDTAKSVREGEQAAIDGIQGKIPLQVVADKVASAEQSLQAGIALRDKIVAAYLEISRMTI